jgi:hypothetical protein
MGQDGKVAHLTGAAQSMGEAHIHVFVAKAGPRR